MGGEGWEHNDLFLGATSKNVRFRAGFSSAVVLIEPLRCSNWNCTLARVFKVNIL